MLVCLLPLATSTCGGNRTLDFTTPGTEAEDDGSDDEEEDAGEEQREDTNVKPPPADTGRGAPKPGDAGSRRDASTTVRPKDAGRTDATTSRDASRPDTSRADTNLVDGPPHDSGATDARTCDPFATCPSGTVPGGTCYDEYNCGECGFLCTGNDAVCVLGRCGNGKAMPEDQREECKRESHPWCYYAPGKIFCSWSDSCPTGSQWEP